MILAMGNGKHYNTLFLDRDGVLNHQRKHDYVKVPEEFVWIDGALEALFILAQCFQRIVIVTNQRGVGRGIMTHANLEDINRKMLQEVNDAGGRIDRIYVCTATDDMHPDRKPNIGMGQQAVKDFPDIIISDSWLAGDSRSDIQFANRMGLKSALIGKKYHKKELSDLRIDVQCEDLLTFALRIQKALES